MPRGRNDTHLPQAVSFCTGIRHALVESSVKIVGGCVDELSTVANRPLARQSRQIIAWCTQLVPNSTSRVCFGCKHFGAKVFE